MTAQVSIDFISDVVCPWCALGATALEQAIANVAGEISVELTYKPFELNPNMPAEGEKAVEICQRGLHRLAKVRAFIDFMAEHFARMDYERKWTGRFAVY